MKPIKRTWTIVLLVGCILGHEMASHAAETPADGEVRLAAYNVLFGNWAEQVIAVVTSVSTFLQLAERRSIGSHQVTS